MQPDNCGRRMQMYESMSMVRKISLITYFRECSARDRENANAQSTQAPSIINDNMDTGGLT